MPMNGQEQPKRINQNAPIARTNAPKAPQPTAPTGWLDIYASFVLCNELCAYFN